ncbi:ribbon-helix-helix protein, CopG family [Mycolicibacterium brumae]|uniref:CopG family transcriptional regulator n=1 Tax=Mycolicibacterium brumae TaxID=85968 RepID=A0A2G5PE29_9MYCO|nr:ribbon-helix-helix protein, CopG family [Mycolicibacterium brumae]MCV7191837.1 CopG family transcriptional regulator [Mycolicibacterium brumae]PIB76283.1 CopG family transcriptional regulator [Mycolicibacterium brumae]RWA15784.1 hypothetical protein MBRU_09540 [Mycolicibacterium brumae DSM 44177]UWW07143.1 ribbon-helix-helix domain-containing protein [Mycolicibacterium brumae]
MAKRTDDAYAAMAADFEANPPAPNGPITVYPDRLRTGRPSGRRVATGNTPAISVRFPADLRRALDDRAGAEDAPVAEIIRRAVADYLRRHSA